MRRTAHPLPRLSVCIEIRSEKFAVGRTPPKNISHKEQVAALKESLYRRDRKIEERERQLQDKQGYCGRYHIDEGDCPLHGVRFAALTEVANIAKELLRLYMDDRHDGYYGTHPHFEIWQQEIKVTWAALRSALKKAGIE